MLFSWMKSLIMYLIIAGIAVNLSPGKKYKRYISFFSGMVVIIILAEPITYVLGIADGNLSVFAGSVDRYLKYNYSLNEAGSIYDYYDMSLEESVRKFLSDRNIKTERITVITGEDKRLMKIYVYMSGQPDDGQTGQSVSDGEIKKYLQEVYNLDIDSIYVIRR